MAIEKIVIPAAGRGLRMMPLSRAVPKELLPLADRPLIHYLAVEASMAGARELVFVVPKGDSALRRYFQEDAALLAELRGRGLHAAAEALGWLSAHGITARVVSQAQPRGLGDAILCARETVGHAPFGVLLPDVWVHPPEAGMPALASRFQRDGESTVLLAEVPAAEVQKYGIAATVPRPGPESGPESGPGAAGEISEEKLLLRAVVEKPEPAAAPSRLALVGRYLFTPELFDLLENTAAGHDGEIQLTDALAALLQKQPVQGLPCTGEVHDCGHPAGYVRAFLTAVRQQPAFREALLPSTATPD